MKAHITSYYFTNLLLDRTYLDFDYILSCQLTPFSPSISDYEEQQVLEVLMLCCGWEKKLSDFGIEWSSNSFIFIGQLALCT